ncbi:putative benzoate 4-monooxygenase cytochrome P450 [Talaromyces proteolyticus]|uniref:Benzoate 4-monooxygenase cytochrome P450 n=1 Tax=Talaromyces proteolyticus TaxID=1131652 RepID=A0AAD4KTB4_9EURO|nr:putative benzoate 4-monooxygenase cytochrome P450 [Talaromyces proteolyticus]KAH8700528.1 putative benzoate 4-monooxygenase cytochrome P450 [Talaromyces proteolyticus]
MAVVSTTLSFLQLGMQGASVLLPALIVLRCIYRLFWHPLSGIPGPKIAACTSLWLAYHTFVGDESSVIFELHRKYGRTLRVAPKDVDIDDGDAVEPIYAAQGGFPKTPQYSKFDIDGHNTIFSALTLPERARRAKAVSPLFSTASIRNANATLDKVIDDFVQRLRTDGQTGEPVNLLNAARSMAIDAISAYLFQQRYGGVEEKTEIMSASPFVDAFVGVGAFFNLFPGPVGDLVQKLADYWCADAKSNTAFALIDSFTKQLIASSVPKSGSYQSRLLEQVSPQQSQIELKDACFAGTDSTGTNTATIIWYLTKYPDMYSRLCEEVHQRTAQKEDPSTGPYLRGVVREGLRLSWANPTRLPREVPKGGWQFKGRFYPEGTSVGVSTTQLHLDEAVFPEPQSFLPERWENATVAMLTNFFAFGKGTRTCIAKNLAMAELTLATLKVAQSDILRGAEVVTQRIELKEWFNSRIKDEEIIIRLAK